MHTSAACRLHPTRRGLHSRTRVQAWPIKNRQKTPEDVIYYFGHSGWISSACRPTPCPRIRYGGGVLLAVPACRRRSGPGQHGTNGTDGAYAVLQLFTGKCTEHVEPPPHLSWPDGWHPFASQHGSRTSRAISVDQGH